MIEHHAPTLPRRSDSVLFRELRGGPGAPMFEGSHGATRIRRTPVRAVASIADSEGRKESFSQVLNLSPGGCYIKGDVSLSEGDEVIMHITLLGGQRQRIDVRAVVLRAEREGARCAYGMGFIAATAREREALEWLYGCAVSQR